MRWPITLFERTHLIHCHELLRCIFFVLSQRNEFDILWRSGLISERSLDSVQIMGTDGYELSSSTEILMKFVLQINERRVGPFSERNTAQNRARKVRPNLLSLQNCKLTEIVKSYRINVPQGWLWPSEDHYFHQEGTQACSWGVGLFLGTYEVLEQCLLCIEGHISRHLVREKFLM